ncbi:hypothetical protein CONPUDRAFT_146974 [Coniophora puteana RWD-64-598 SS2]|uniref:Uncharacterized protein n=1 Tax=Coniophora puteana (strain RWD-64-598) TaxID=741705 RepID=A0A5M3M9W1_CONPW|nr:uncharacterized protein CONPUDRAFT_146974 [Coniophora puteana RWD-64-598 SS2]EIW75887.1 hypothetical protein CONPUDRAFT_146974 [Coniophora puteana RWD-64-598 SS2]
MGWFIRMRWSQRSAVPPRRNVFTDANIPKTMSTGTKDYRTNDLTFGALQANINDRLSGVAKALRRFTARRTRGRKQDIPPGQDSEEGSNSESHSMHSLHDPPRVLDIIYTSQAEARYVAAGDRPNFTRWQLIRLIFCCASQADILSPDDGKNASARSESSAARGGAAKPNSTGA